MHQIVVPSFRGQAREWLRGTPCSSRRNAGPCTQGGIPSSTYISCGLTSWKAAFLRRASESWGTTIEASSTPLRQKVSPAAQGSFLSGDSSSLPGKEESTSQVLSPVLGFRVEARHGLVCVRAIQDYKDD